MARAAVGLIEALAPDDAPTLVDVGVRWGFAPRWTGLAPPARLVGIEADEAECRRLRARHAGETGARFIAAALSDRAGPATLHLTEDPAAASLLEPNVPLLRSRRGLAALRPTGRAHVQTTTLADLGVGRIDGMKLDVQGAELAVLRGAGALLEDVRVLDLEVEFLPLYRDQPLFVDVDAALAEAGFVLWRLSELAHCGPRAATDTIEPERHLAPGRLARFRAGGGQLAWCRARYVRRNLADPEGSSAWVAHVRDAVVAWAFSLDDLALACASRAVEAGAPHDIERLVARLRRELALARRMGRGRGRDWRAAAQRAARVVRLARRGLDDDRIAREAGVSPGEVRRILRFLRPGRRG